VGGSFSLVFRLMMFGFVNRECLDGLFVAVRHGFSAFWLVILGHVCALCSLEFEVVSYFGF
jgi:hypothetical protein